jgi:hypothetical protein
MSQHKLKNYALNQVKATSADKGAVRNRDLLDGMLDGIE